MTASYPCSWSPVLLLLLWQLSALNANGLESVSRASAIAQSLPAEKDSWQPALDSSAAWQSPSTATEQRSPETVRQARIFPFFEYLTPRARFIPGLAKNSQCCGKENQIPLILLRSAGTRIVGGYDTTPQQYPWMVAIVAVQMRRQARQPSPSPPLCGGSLINDRYVLTSADCIAPFEAIDLAVFLGQYSSTDTPDIFPSLVEQLIPHPEFNPTTKENDIALVKLQTILSLPLAVNNIAPICLPHRSKYTDQIVAVSGYGSVDVDETPSQVLNTVNLRTISNSECGDYLGEDTIEKSMICAGAKNIGAGGMGPCTFDFGGPLMIRTWYDRDRYTLVGVATNRTGCGQPNQPAVFTRVYSFLDWLLDNTEDAVYC
ncbi:trypsin-7-like isoform X1 [Amphibalanus amphitrite]|uniref:trypsin-7-like isoform X1 n=1 Tax=Amphibalanus amphitrite TaxID=1232801 RepID=UPI001C8FBF94|nr:trypsin-7-like isoform X1 [Amphibalanus amphitrite]